MKAADIVRTKDKAKDKSKKMSLSDWVGKRKSGAAERSKVAKEAQKGHDFGKKNKKGKTGFKAVEDKAEKEYGSKEAGEKVAGAAFWRNRGGK